MATVYFRALSPGETPRTAAHGLLEQVLGAPMTAISYDKAGKPRLPGGPEFSLSHTKGAVAVAVDDAPVEVDVECVRPVAPGLPRRVLGEAEYAWYERRGETAEDFFTLWTLKESYYKALGTGLPGFPNETAFFLEGDRWRLPGAPVSFVTWGKKLLRIALCSHAQQVELIDLSQT